MQEVFEKIKNKCQKRSGIGRSSLVAFLEILDEVAEEYNNGWIPVEERLPEERVAVDITIMEDANEVGGKRYYNVRTWLQDGQFRFKKNPYNQVVIAWKYPTEPYQPKGDKE